MSQLSRAPPFVFKSNLICFFKNTKKINKNIKALFVKCTFSSLHKRPRYDCIIKYKNPSHLFTGKNNVLSTAFSRKNYFCTV